MDHVTLEPSKYYQMEALNQGDSRNDVDGIFGSSYMNPMDMRQYLYKLTPTEHLVKELKSKVLISILSSGQTLNTIL